MCSTAACCCSAGRARKLSSTSTSCPLMLSVGILYCTVHEEKFPRRRRPQMSVVHRSVLVLGFFGALIVLFAANGPRGLPSEIWILLFIPLIAAATIIYPIAWIFRRD